MPYGDRPTRWNVEFTPEAERWFMGLSPADANGIAAAFDELEQRGPALDRPFADSLRGSRHHNMKELRSVGGHLRALFAFDPHRRAIVLLGGDKTNDWQGWYRRNIPRADRLYDQHLNILAKEGTSPRRPARIGGQSAGRGR